MSTLKEVFAAQVPALREEVKQINTQYGEKVISEVNVGQAYGGMRGIIAMICDTSVVDSDTGLIIRGRPILDLTDKWPEEIFWLLLTGNLPTAEETKVSVRSPATPGGVKRDAAHAFHDRRGAPASRSRHGNRHCLRRKPRRSEDRAGAARNAAQAGPSISA